MDKTITDPSAVLATGDPGDETQRNFRYQNAYGAILLIAGAVNTEPYSAVWCEHHEDLLAERTDGKYDAYQVKTRQPENGYWHLDAPEICSSIKRFVHLHVQFGVKIRIFAIVSNTEFFECGLTVKVDRLKRSPVRFLEAIRTSDTCNTVSEPFSTVLSEMAVECGCELAVLFDVLKRVYLKKGPSREDFDADLSHNHLTQHPSCKPMAMSLLNAVRDEIIQQIYKAASLQVEDPKRYLLNIEQRTDPVLLSKRVAAEVVVLAIQSSAELIFRYQPVDVTIDLDKNVGAIDVLKSKFTKANLADQFQTMKRRKISSERRLLELSAASPENFQDLLAHLESVVQAECDEATLEVRPTGPNPTPYGPQMLNNVLNRLKNIADQQPGSVYGERYEALVGIAALLTENCSVWWSDKFELNV